MFSRNHFGFIDLFYFISAVVFIIISLTLDVVSSSSSMKYKVRYFSISLVS